MSVLRFCICTLFKFYRTLAKVSTVRLPKYVLIFGLLLIGYSALGQPKTAVFSIGETLKDSGFTEMSASEWKKFRDFEKKLALTPLIPSQQEDQLRAYTRDSLRILEVKLMAVKLLEEKKLLDRDMSENLTYYHSLLGELRESSIPQAEYRFLEEKMAFMNQGAMEEKLGQSRIVIFVLGSLCILLLFFAFRIKAARKSTALPELSKQEVTVRDLILQGKTNKEIANELFISLSTVKTHITNLYGKLNITSRQELLQKNTGTST